MSAEHTVESIPPAALVERAVRNAGQSRPSAERWVHVMIAFSLGSTYAQQLCRLYGVDPYQVVGVDDDAAN